MSEKFEHLVVGGMQRSGTSLLRAIIGSHSAVSVYQWDLPLWTKFSKVYYNKQLSITHQQRLVNEVLNHPKSKKANIKLRKELFKDLLESNGYGTAHNFFIDFYYDFLNQYLKHTNKRIIGLKTPDNEYYAYRIFKSFPRTKFIQLIRNPLDAAVSLREAKKQWWGGPMNYYSHIRAWKKSVDLAHRNAKKYTGQYLVVRYEDLVLKPYETVPKICKFLNIDFEEEMLLMQKQPGWKGSNSSFKEKEDDRIKFKKDAIYRYKKRLPESIKNRYFRFLHDDLVKFDYPVKSVSKNLGEQIQFKANNMIETGKENITNTIMESNIYHPLKTLVELTTTKGQ